MLLRQPPRHLDRVPDALTQREDLINLLQTPPRGLREEEPDTRHPGRVQDRIDDEIPVPDVREADGRYFRDEKIEEPGNGGTEAADGGAELDGCDFRSIEERDPEEADGVDDVVELWVR